MPKPNRTHRFVMIAAAMLPPGLAQAQDKPISVYFRPGEVKALNDAIIAAMLAKGFALALEPTPGALIVSFSDKIKAEVGRVSGTTWSFTVAFSRDGASLGHAEEGCNEKKMAECTDQLMTDIQSAAGAP